MRSALRLAGFFGAHAVWSVCDGEDLVPIAAAETDSGERTMNRFVCETLQEGAKRAQAWATDNPEKLQRTVAICDGYITLASGKTDALLLTVCLFERRRLGFLKPALQRRLVMAIPYRSARSNEGFAVFRPKFLEFDGPEDELDVLADAFFQGVDQHEQGAANWNARIDESQ